MQPRLIVPRITAVNPTLLRDLGISGLLIDLDDTLVRHNSPIVDEDITSWFRTVRSDFPCRLMTNNYNGRHIDAVLQTLDIPADQIFMGTKLRPRPFLYSLKKAIASLGLPPAEIAVIGDSIVTDIWPANRLGCFSIYVYPIDSEIERRCPMIRWDRWFEQHILSFLTNLPS